MHDDLPALDNDDYRRGRYTTHKEFGEAAAILAGDGLLHQAYETFIKAFDYGVSEQTVKALRIFGDCTGIKGMLGGQAADVLNCGMEIADDLMYYIYDLKTGALIKGSMMIGAALAGAADLQNFLPAIVFVVACLIAFATGTSWGTFGVLVPVAVTLLGGSGTLVFLTVSATLGGAVFGDHVSPISDTTILSSTGGNCNHVDHVRTQFPYAGTIAVISAIAYVVAGLLANLL